MKGDNLRSDEGRTTGFVFDDHGVVLTGAWVCVVVVVKSDEMGLSVQGTRGWAPVVVAAPFASLARAFRTATANSH